MAKAKTHDCVLCNEAVSELGSYVKVASMYQHLHCYKLAITANILQEAEEAAQKQRDDATRAASIAAQELYNKAPRCARCGVVVMVLRPALLGPSYRTAVPSSVNLSICAECVRAEIIARTHSAPVNVLSPVQSSPAKAPEPAKAADPDKRWERIEID